MKKGNISKRKPFKHEQITQQILENIRNGNLEPGHKLPSLRQLSAEFECNYLTVNRSFEQLEQMGLIEKRPGSGSYVRDTAINISGIDKVKKYTAPKKKNKVGILMIPGAGGHFVSGMMKAYHNVSSEMGLTLNIRTVSEFGPKNMTQIKSLMSQGCCAIMIPWWPREQNMSEIHKLISSSMLPIVIPQRVQGLEKNHQRVTPASNSFVKSRTTLACRYFKELGYKNIAIVGTDIENENGPFQSMMMDYTRFVNKHHLQNYIGLVEDKKATDYDRLVLLWKHLAGDLAVVCYFDEMAIRFMTAVHKIGLRIPEDVAILGYNNITEAEFSDPPLSTIQCPFNTLAERSLIHALYMCGEESYTPKYSWEQEFIIRSSCGGKLRAGKRVNEILEILKN